MSAFGFGERRDGSERRQNVAFERDLQCTGIAFTEVKVPGRIEDIAKAIPFLGFLMGFAYIGHNVVIFEGHPSAFTHSLAEADLLLVDAQMIPFLQKDWLDIAFKMMRKPEICVFQPGGQVQKIARKTN